MLIQCHHIRCCSARIDRPSTTLKKVSRAPDHSAFRPFTEHEGPASRLSRILNATALYAAPPSRANRIDRRKLKWYRRFDADRTPRSPEATNATHSNNLAHDDRGRTGQSTSIPHTQPAQCMQSTQCMQRRGVAESAATPAFILRAFRPPPTPDNFTTDVRHQRHVPLPPLAPSSAMRSTMIDIVDASPRKIHNGLRNPLEGEL